MFTIEKGIPVPAARNTSGSMYPFRLMEVGDSFLLADESMVKRARASANVTGKRMGAKFACRKVSDGWRFWRVS
jgi:hypothetical protein